MAKKGLKSIFKPTDPVMTPNSSATFRRIQIRYSEDYLPFVNAMIRRVGKAHSGFLMEIREVIQEVIADLGKLMSGKAQKDAQKKLINRVIENIESVDTQLENFKKAQANSDKVVKAIENSEKKTGVAFDELTKDQKFIKAGLKKAKPKGPGLVEQLKGMAPQAFATGEDLTKGLAQAVLGPFAGMAQLAGQTGTGIYKGIREKIIKRKEERLSQGLKPVSTKLSPEIAGEIAALEKSGTPTGKIFKPGGLAPDIGVPSAPGETVGKKAAPAPAAALPPALKTAKAGAAPAMEMKPKTIKDMAKPMEFFFDKLAYKTKWTADLMKEIKKLTKTTKEGGGKGFLGGMFGGGFMTALKSAFPFLIGTLIPVLLGGAALAAIGVLADKLIRKAVPARFHKFLNVVSPIEWVKNWRQNFKTIADMAYKLTQSIRDMAGDVKGFLASAFKRVKDVALSALKGIADGVKSIGSLVMGPIKKLGKLLTKAFAGLEEILDPIKAIGKTIVDKFSGFFEKFKFAFPRSASATPMRETPRQVTASGVPAKTSSSGVDDRVVRSLNALVERVEKALSSIPAQTAGMPGGAGAMSKPVVDDVYGTRDPLLGALNSGGLEVGG